MAITHSATTIHELSSPLMPPLAYRVGVVGHRPNRLTHADQPRLSAVLHEILKTVQDEVLEMARRSPDLFAKQAPILRAISPLAEGTDRLFAKEALALGYELCCVMPFLQAEYEKDFPDSVKDFRDLLASATQFELDSSPTNRPQAYGTGGRVVLNQSDLLIVVWDGEKRGQIGGTEETMAIALKQGTTVAWVDAYAPHHWQFLKSSVPPGPADSSATRAEADGSGALQKLREVVKDAIDIPAPKQQEHTEERNPREGLQEFLTEDRPRFSIAILWSLFQEVVTGEDFGKLRFKVEPFEAAVAGEWPADTSNPVATMVDRLRPYYAWPDKLAVLYANRYRSTYVLAFLVAAFAVAMTLLPVAAKFEENGPADKCCLLLELSSIGTIIIFILVGKWRRWHERWLDYRLVAELVRHLRLVAPLGGERLFPQVPAHLATYGSPAATWMAWYVRTVERAVGLPGGILDTSHLKACLTHLSTLLEGQIKFHKKNASRSHLIEHRLHFGGIVLLGLTFLACALHLVMSLWAIPYPCGLSYRPLFFMCGFFPALGAAFAGISNQGEFRRIVRISSGTEEEIEQVLADVKSLQSFLSGTTSNNGMQMYQKIIETSRAAASSLVREVLGWRVVFLDQPLRPPG